MPAAPQDLEPFVRRSRRTLWVALGVILFYGVTAVVRFGFELQVAPEARRLLSILLPIFIIVAVAVIRGSSGFSPASIAAMQAIFKDELRQASLNRAYRNAFLALLLAQPVLILLLSSFPVVQPVALMGAACSAGGLGVFLASLLYYDR